MQLSPAYGPDPVIRLDGDPAAVLEPTVRQRRRLAAVLAEFTEAQWTHPSRCEGWSSRDVVLHLESTNRFWAFAVASGLNGEPTQFLTGFDPAKTPADLVTAEGDISSAETLERFVASNEALLDVLEPLDADGWTTLAEAPPGHLSVSAVMHHALWDGWVHERDVLLPLGIAPAEEADEITASLRYAAALGPALALNLGATETGVLAIRATAPDVEAVVAISDHVAVRAGTDEADLVLAGSAVDLLEAFSVRGPFAQAVPPEGAWMVQGLPQTFDVV